MKLPLFARSSAVVLAAAAVAGCGLVPAVREPAEPSDTGAARVGAAVNHTQQSSSAPIAAPLEIEAQRNTPPDGLLSSGGAAVAGQPGSYCYRSTCADIGRWPAKADLPLLTVTTGKVRFALGGNEPFVRWNAAYNDNANDDQATELGQGGHAFEPDATSSPPPQLEEALIEAPPAGDWVMWVWVDLEQGDLSYAWHVTVMPDTATE